MDISLLLDIVHKSTVRTIFYGQCNNYLKELSKTTKSITKIANISNITEPIRLLLLSVLPTPSYKLYFTTYKMHTKKALSYRPIKLSQLGMSNLLSQMEEDICLANQQTNTKKIYFLIMAIDTVLNEDDNQQVVQLNYTYENINLFMGIGTMDFLQHQNLTRYCQLAQSTTNTMSVNTFNNFHNLHKTLNEIQKERLLLFGTSVLTALGTTHDNLVEMLYLVMDDEKAADINNIKEKILIDDNYRCYFINKNSIEVINPITNNNQHYMFEYFTKDWPRLVNANNIYEVYCNPQHWFHFMGMKFASAELTIQSAINKLQPESFVRLILMDKYNGYSDKNKICFPNLSITKGNVTVFNDAKVNTSLNETAHFLKILDGIDMSLDELKKIVPKCRETPWAIYSKYPNRNNYTNGVIKYHTLVMNHYIETYFDRDILLDVGAGPLRQISFYEKIGFKRLVAIEPSIDSINTGKEQYKKYCKNIKLDIIEGFGEEDWHKGNKYKAVIAHAPYKSILFKFTIHYMLKGIDTLMSNIKSVSQKDTVIIVSCLDGTKIIEKLKSAGKYEIYQDNEVLYGVYDFEDIGNSNKNDDFRQIMVYFKGVYGVDAGSIEYVVNLDYLIKKFKSIGFSVITSNNFMEIDSVELKKITHNFNPSQKKISELHHVIIFKKL